MKLINGRSGKLLNNLENIKTRKIWDEYYVYYVDNEKLLPKIKGYVIGNPYKHKEVELLEDLTNYPYSSYSEVVDESSRAIADEMILSVIKMSTNDIIKNMKRIRDGVEHP